MLLDTVQDEEVGDTVHERRVHVVLLGNCVRCAVALGPSRDALHEAGLGRRDLLQAFLKLFPDTRHGEEGGWAGPLKRVNEGSLESVWPCKVDLANIAHVLEKVEGESGDVRQRQVRDDAVLGADSFRPLPLGHARHAHAFPAEVIVTQHATLGVTSGSTSVDKAAAFAGLLTGHLLSDNFVFDGGSHL